MLLLYISLPNIDLEPLLPPPYASFMLYSLLLDRLDKLLSKIAVGEDTNSVIIDALAALWSLIILSTLNVADILNLLGSSLYSNLYSSCADGKQPTNV